MGGLAQGLYNRKLWVCLFPLVMIEVVYMHFSSPPPPPPPPSFMIIIILKNSHIINFDPK